MRSQVYVTVRCPSVCPSVCLSHSPAAAACGKGLLLCARRLEDIDRLLHGRRRSSKCGQCHVYGRRRKLNTNLLYVQCDGSDAASAQ